jgi:hypothetical protein
MWCKQKLFMCYGKKINWYWTWALFWLQIVIMLDGKMPIYHFTDISEYYQFTRKNIILLQNITTSLKFWWNDDISYEKRQQKSQCSSKLRNKGTRYALSLFLIDYSEPFMLFEIKNVSFQHFSIATFSEVHVFLDTSLTLGDIEIRLGVSCCSRKIKTYDIKSFIFGWPRTFWSWCLLSVCVFQLISHINSKLQIFKDNFPKKIIESIW